MSCAAACVRQLAKDMNINLSERIIREAINTTHRGTDAKDLYLGIRKLFENKTIIGEVWYTPGVSDLKKFTDNISTIDGSFITNVGFGNKKHAIIVDKIVGNDVYIRDPWPLKGYDTKSLIFDNDGFVKSDSVKWLEKSGVEAVVDFNNFIEEWALGGNLIIKVK